ncbi:glycosyltransferase [Candidatus Harpocratesius sp.]
MIQNDILARLLIVHHGFPPEHEAGSEVYTYNLANILKNYFNIRIFYRTLQNVPRYMKSVEKEGILHYIIQEPDELEFTKLHEQPKVDEHFRQILSQFKPHFVYFGHLNHLSLSLVSIAKSFGVIIIFTLHDYWLLCPRGQFLGRDRQICEPPDINRCIRCIQAKYTQKGKIRSRENCLILLRNREKKIREIFSLVDLFIAPSIFLRNLFIKFGLDPKKCVYRDYGFNLKYFENFSMDPRKNRRKRREIVFGYCGTAIPSKGLDILIDAFEILQETLYKNIKNNQIKSINQELSVRLNINASRHAKFDDYYKELISKVKHNSHIQFMGKYSNGDVACVFEQCDVLIVPSIWYENSPLVIHEAFQARIPVITSNKGGMAELITNHVNGLLFSQGDAADLAEKMFYLIQHPNQIEILGKAHPKVHSIESDARFIQQLFIHLNNSQQGRITVSDMGTGPWRITFDTNPDDCNLSCIMCEGFSKYNRKNHRERVKKGNQRRMKYEMIEKVVWNALPFGLEEIIPSTMGEPLLYDDFERIIDLCHETGVALNLTTNGTFPKRSAAEWANLIIPVASDVKISWNSPTPEIQEKIMIGSKFTKRLADLQDFIKIRNELYKTTGHYCRITLQMTFMEQNYAELPQMVEFAYNLGVDRIKGHHLWVLYPEMEDQSMLRNGDAINRWNEIVKEAFRKRDDLLNTAQSNKPNGSFKPFPNKAKELVLDNIFTIEFEQSSEIPFEWECPFLRREAWIAWDGTFNICCAPDNLRKSLGIWGSVRDNDFMVLWLQDSLERLQKHYKTKSICQSCVLRRPAHKIKYGAICN